MEEIPLVSIVTPSLNKGHYIEETILSVQNQTYPKIEHIVIDGGSTDGTLDILRKYNDRITWISEPDHGQSDAINKGWRMANGEIIAYLNADDTYMPMAVQTAVQFFKDNPSIHMVYGDCKIIDEHSNTIGSIPVKEFKLAHILCGICFVPQPSVFLRKTILDAVGYLDGNLHVAMDLDLWIRIGLNLEVQYIPELLANFRYYPGTKSASITRKFWMERFDVLDKIYSRADLTKEVKSLKNMAYSYAHFEMGFGYYQQREMKKARPHLMRSIMISPIQLKEPRAVILAKSFLGNSVLSIVDAWRSKAKGILFKKNQST
jgi:glycosyltransferase involved in cell wall biosynthesis